MNYFVARPAWRHIVALAVVAFSAGCSTTGDDAVSQSGDTSVDASHLFSRMPASVTGIAFANRLRETSELNVFTYRNFYNGGGVAIADLNGDGRPEVVLTSNQEGPKLYLNKGQFHFRDITKAAGLTTDRGSWTTGVAIGDVNGDGLLDIYICRAGPGTPEQRANQLWINQGVDKDSVPHFKEMAKEYGVADEGYSTQAAFLDYDHDGKLDLFVIENSPRSVSNAGLRNLRSQRSQYGGAKLYHNDGGHFTDVTAQVGIYSPDIAFGLGVAVADVNNDGWPDIYVSNDFAERDYLYINNRDGTFSELLDREMPVISYFSMGLDVADLGNSGWLDVYTTDMLPEDQARLATTSTFDSWETYQSRVQGGYHHQIMRNMLQRNNGDSTFSDVGQMAGVARTDWSWSALIADIDLDGRKDIFVTNGIAKDVTSQDYIAFIANGATIRSMTNDGRQRADFLKLSNAMTSTPLRNYAFHNTGGLHFTNEAAAWGLATPSFSSGAAYGDLDGDGALDLIVNNVDQEAFVYRNNARTLHPESHFLRVALVGEGGNRFGIGARVTAYAARDMFMQEESPQRGFQSSVDYVLDFGLGAHGTVDSLCVRWPSGKVTTLRAMAANQLVTAREHDAIDAPHIPHLAPRAPLVDVTAETKFDFKHQENAFVDFAREPLMPKLLSTEGPYIAVGDVNGDGLDDVYIGGAKNQPGRLLIQQRDGRFVSANDSLFAADALSEDLGAVFVDVNGDGRPDLYVVSGGNEFNEGATGLQDRLYLNDGHGKFHKAPAGHLPTEASSGSRVVAADYDGNGTIDLFVGGRVSPWAYGADPESMLLRNDGTGHFSNVTATLAPELQHVGMVTDALWRDVDGDGRPDLIVVGEWMPITIFHNEGGGRLKRIPVKGLENSNGFWNRIIAGDFNGDGKIDFIVANLGLNSLFQASPNEPVTMYVKDFDRNDMAEQIISVYNHGVSYPLPQRDELLAALPFLASRFPRYKDYAGKTVTDIFTPRELSNAVVKKAYTFATSLVLNNGDGSFKVVPLPDEAQIAPVYGMLAADIDHDGHIDLLVAGNFDGFKPQIGRMAASYGLVLRGDGKGNFLPERPRESGFFVPGQARDIARIRTARGDLYVVTRNNDRPLFFRASRGEAIATRGTAPSAARAIRAER